MWPLFEFNNPKLNIQFVLNKPHNIQNVGYNYNRAIQEQTDLQRLNATTTKFSVPFVIALHA